MGKERISEIIVICEDCENGGKVLYEGQGKDLMIENCVAKLTAERHVNLFQHRVEIYRRIKGD